MSLTKKILAAAVVSALSATTAHAQVVLSDSAANVTPALYATEITVAPAGTAFAAVAANEIRSNLLYAFSGDEIRYARVECSSNFRFAVGSPATVTVADDDTTAVAGASVGAVNGLGSNAISFSITAPAGGLVATNAIRVAGARTLTSKDAVNCTYSLYDQPSQAASGGEAGRIATSGSKSAVTFAESLALRAVPADRVADVEADPSFTEFVTPADDTANLGRVLFNLRSDVSAALSDTPVLAQPLLANGTVPANPGVFVTADSFHTITGDFSFAEDEDSVFFSATAGCAAGISADEVTATTARFDIGATEVDLFLCVTGNGNTFAVSDYSQVFTADSTTNYTVNDIGPVALGSITRNGTEIQAPLAQVPAGYQSRIALTNTGSTPRTYSIEVLLENGNTRNGDPSQLTGTVPANSLHVVELATLMGTFTAAPRGTVNVTVAGPSNQIQGLYQIVNPANGSISNHVMVRPDSN